MTSTPVPIVTTRIPARLDRLPFSRWHVLVVVALGVTWLLDGLEGNLAGSLAGVLKRSDTLALTDADLGISGSVYLLGSVVGALAFGYATDRYGRKKLFSLTLLLYLGATAATAFSFNVSNSATLPLVGQIFAQGDQGARSASWKTALAVLVAEAVMVGVAALVGKKADAWGRKSIFVAAFAVLATRNALGVASHAPAYLIALQAMDGAAPANYGVLLKLVTADLAKGSGRFNALQGAVQSSMALGGFLSNLAFGLIAKRLGWNVAFLGLPGVAVLGGLLYGVAMPEIGRGRADARRYGRCFS